MTAYYNEVDQFASQWLSNLLDEGAVAAGFVDTRSIVEIRPEDLVGHVQCHFFAGIGVWSYALRQAGWPDTLPAWTGSCPCQPFSVAGKRKGFSDQRHLWPNWFRLINVSQPPIILGEQVASPDGLTWLDTVQTDLEGAGYTFAAIDTCAAGFGAPHLRQRLYWVAIARGERCEGIRLHLRQRQERSSLPQARRSSQADPLSLGAPSCSGSWWLDRTVPGAQEESQSTRKEFGRRFDKSLLSPGPVNGFWRESDWLLGRDGKARPVEPGTFPVAPRASGDLGRLRAYGNSLCAPQAIGFVKAVMETLCEP